MLEYAEIEGHFRLAAKVDSPQFPVIIKKDKRSKKEGTVCYNTTRGDYGWCGVGGANAAIVAHDKHWGWCSKACHKK